MCHTPTLYILDARETPREVWLPLRRFLPPRRAALLDDAPCPEREKEIVLGFALFLYAMGAENYPPDADDWVIGTSGKPETASGLPHFSLAHAGGVLALALSEKHPVGVDIEPLRPHAPALARKLKLPRESGAESVLRAWCATEAAAKKSGAGIAATLARNSPPDAAVKTENFDGQRFILALSPGEDFAVRRVTMENIAAALR